MELGREVPNCKSNGPLPCPATGLENVVEQDSDGKSEKGGKIDLEELLLLLLLGTADSASKYELHGHGLNGDLASARTSYHQVDNISSSHCP